MKHYYIVEFIGSKTGTKGSDSSEPTRHSFAGPFMSEEEAQKMLPEAKQIENGVCWFSIIGFATEDDYCRYFSQEKPAVRLKHLAKTRILTDATKEPTILKLRNLPILVGPLLACLLIIAIASSTKVFLAVFMLFIILSLLVTLFVILKETKRAGHGNQKQLMRGGKKRTV